MVSKGFCWHQHDPATISRVQTHSGKHTVSRDRALWTMLINAGLQTHCLHAMTSTCRKSHNGANAMQQLSHACTYSRRSQHWNKALSAATFSMHSCHTHQPNHKPAVLGRLGHQVMINKDSLLINEPCLCRQADCQLNDPATTSTVEMHSINSRTPRIVDHVS